MCAIRVCNMLQMIMHTLKYWGMVSSLLLFCCLVCWSVVDVVAVVLGVVVVLN